MGCNCKRAMEFESKHGVPMEETKSQKYGRLFLRGVFFAIAIALTFILTPIIIVWSLYKLCFCKNNDLVMPRFLAKYMK